MRGLLSFTNGFPLARRQLALRSLTTPPQRPICAAKPETTPSAPSTNSEAFVRNAEQNFTLLSEERIFHRYQTIWSRAIKFPTGQTVEYDVLGNASSEFKSVFIFPFDTTSRTTTLLHEYAPGQNRISPAFVTGMFERGKHKDLEDAARAELSEEALLMGGHLVPLTGSGVAADKYSRNRFHYFLALDCVPDEQPRPRDEEEWIEVRAGVGLKEVQDMVVAGAFNAPHSLLALLAMEKLKDLGVS